MVFPTQEGQIVSVGLHPMLTLIATPSLPVSLFSLFFLTVSPNAQGTEGDRAKKTLVSVGAKHPVELEDAPLYLFILELRLISKKPRMHLPHSSALSSERWEHTICVKLPAWNVARG